MEGSRNNACIVPDNMSFFDSEYGAYTNDLEYISSYVADDVQRYFNLNVKPGTKLGTDLVRGLREDLSATVHNAAGAKTIVNKSSHNPGANPRYTAKDGEAAAAEGVAGIQRRATDAKGQSTGGAHGSTNTGALINMG